MGLGPSGVIFPSAYAALVACAAPAVMVVTVRLATKLMLASASPRNPNEPNAARSSNVEILEVAYFTVRAWWFSGATPESLSATSMVSAP